MKRILWKADDLSTSAGHELTCELYLTSYCFVNNDYSQSTKNVPCFINWLLSLFSMTVGIPQFEILCRGSEGNPLFCLCCSRLLGSSPYGGLERALNH